MRKSFKSKLIIPVVMILIVLIGSISGILSLQFANFNNNLVVEEIKSSSKSMAQELEGMEQKTKYASSSMSQNPSAAEAMLSRDLDTILALFSPTLQLYGVDYYTICDNEGNVLARTHEPEKFGDSVLNQQNIQDALAGKSATYYEAGSAVKVSVRTGAPVYDSDGNLVGAISAGIRFDNDAFVDHLKSLYNAEATVFSGNERVATTIYQDGKRAVGTKLGDAIAKIVIDDKQEYYGEADILGTKYKTFYKPLLNAKNETFAIVFIGVSMEKVTNQTYVFIQLSIIIGVVGLIISIIVLYVVTNMVSKPIVTLTRVLNNVAGGKLNEQIQIKSKDELGQLGSALQQVINVFHDLLDDINVMAREREKGDTDYQADPSKYKGDYRRLAEDIVGLVNTSYADTLNLLHTLNEFNKGNFDADIPKMPGKKIVLNQQIDGMRDNMKNINGEIGRLVAKAMEGDLSVRSDTRLFEGDWKELISELNRLMETIAAPINEAEIVMRQVSQGDFSQHMTGDYKGAFLIIKEAVNNTVTNVSAYIKEISNVLNNLSNNNLDQEITREYVGEFSDIKTALNEIIRQLNTIITDIYNAADQVASGAKQISESSMTLAQGTSEQSSAISNLNDTIKQVSEAADNNADNAKKAEELTAASRINAEKGNTDMGSMLASMERINQSSENIANIIKIMDEIALQTNMLALNAAVEAARAGENGRGFMVVADEVRNLASRNLNASKEIAVLIEESKNRVSEGSQIAGITAETLHAIVDDTNSVANIVTSIADSSGQQTKSVDLAATGLSQIASVIQGNSSLSEESASAAQELSSQAEVLINLVNVFKLKSNSRKL